ncbi:MAG: hypothetical protein V4751_06895 [Pseudomonadota bacterium]
MKILSGQAARTPWRLLVSVGLLYALGVSTASVSSAQEPDAQMDELRKSIDIFAGVLREALGLNNRAGIFSPLNGSVQGLYLAEQGVVLELVTPLSSSRPFDGMQSLSSSLQELSGQLSNMAATQSFRLQRIELNNPSSSSDPALEPYRALMARLASIDFSAEMESSLRSATEAARSLNLVGHFDQAQYDALVQEMGQLREQMSERILAFQELRNRISNESAAAQTPDAAVTERWQSEIDALQRSIEPIREAARVRAQALREQSEQSRLAREEQWQRDLVAFEINLFKIVCDYSAALRMLPEEEHLTLVLKGLGEETDSRREDRIHVLPKADMQRCLQGEMTSQQLQDSARSYSF